MKDEAAESLDRSPHVFQAKKKEIIGIFQKAINKTTKLLSSLGHKTYVPAFDPKIQDYETLSNDFSHKMAATASGLGWIGKSSLLVTPQYGPRIRLATVLTNAQFQTSVPTFKDQCGSCRICIDACPFNAIKDKHWSLEVKRENLVDAHKCYELGKKYFNKNGQKYRCGKCLQVCPTGK